VDTQFFRPDGSQPDGSALVVSALVPYKRVDLAIEACRRCAIRLRIVGRGPELQNLRRLAGPDVEFLGTLSDDDVRTCYRRSSVTLFPGEEDFGIVPLEAQACGRPVVALGRGGALETVVDGKTGVLVPDSSPEALADGIVRAIRTPFHPAAIRRHAEAFGRKRFAGEIARVVSETLRAPAGTVTW
jgi:glycosyltransferase involved in cell wall biosynthesis